jgi:hypothetical protein
MAAVVAAAEREVAVLYAAYTVKAGDLKYVAAGLPTKPEDQARVERRPRHVPDGDAGEQGEPADGRKRLEKTCHRSRSRKFFSF